MNNVFENEIILKKINQRLKNLSFIFFQEPLYSIKKNISITASSLLTALLYFLRSSEQYKKNGVQNKQQILEKNNKLSSNSSNSSEQENKIIIQKTKRQLHKDAHEKDKNEWKLEFSPDNKKTTKVIEVFFKLNNNKRNLNTPEIIDLNLPILENHNPKLVRKFLLWINVKKINLPSYEGEEKVETLFDLYMKIGEDPINDLIINEKLNSQSKVNLDTLINHLNEHLRLKKEILENSANIEFYLRNYYEIITGKKMKNNLQDLKSFSEVVETFNQEYKQLNFDENLRISLTKILILRNFLTHNSIYNKNIKSLKKENKESINKILKWIKKN